MKRTVTNNLIFAAILLFAIIVWLSLTIYHNEKSGNSHHPVVLVEITKAKLMPVSKTLGAYGTVSFSPENTQQVMVQNDIWIQKVFVTQGQQVKKDEPLLKILPTANADLNVKNATINVEFAQKELDRLSQLRTQYLSTNAEVQTAGQNLAKAQAELNNLHIKGDGQLLRTSFDSTVVTLNAQPGQVVPAATSLLSLANPAYKQVRLGVETEDLNLIHVGQQVIVRAVYDTRLSFNGYIRHITGQIDPTTGLIDVIVPLETAEKLIPGSMVHGEIMLQPKTNQVVVPHSAILFQHNQAYVFINNQGKAEQRYVSVDGDQGQLTVITKGIKANEEVISTGNYELHNGALIRVEQP